MKSLSNSSKGFDISDTANRGLSLPSWRRVNRFLRQNWLGMSVLVGAVAVSFLPYEFRPGGRIELLPLNQQKVQARVSGRINRVLVDGGDGKLIKSGAVIATLDAPDQENEYRKTQENIKNQQAVLQEAEANLNKLLNTPRSEDVEVARKQVETAQKQVEAAQKQVEAAQKQVEVARGDLQTAISLSKASTSRAKRYTELYELGAYSQQQAEDAQRQADSEREDVSTQNANVLAMQSNVAIQQSNVATQRSNVATRQQEIEQARANLKLVLAGSQPDEIQAARSRVMAARTEIQRLEQQLSYLKDQLERTQVRMPFNGRIVDNELHNKVGTYLKQGDTFSTAEVANVNVLLAKLQVPEVAADQLFPDRKVTLKLLAYPNDPVYGRVVAIRHAASKQKVQEEQSEISGDKVISSHEDDGRVVEAIVELPNPDGKFRPGMTGYAKIEGTTMPVIIAFSRSLVRFVKVEIWSWLP